MKRSEISYITHEGLDRKRWDRCVENDPHAAVFFYSWFLDIVCPGWDALKAGDYDAVFPLPHKSRFGISYIFQPFFTRTLDACSPRRELRDPLPFLSHIPAKFRLQEFCIEFEPNTPGILPASSEKKYQALFLDKNYTTIRKKYSSNTNNNIKKGEKAFLVCHDQVSAGQIASDFQKHKGKVLHQFSSAEYGQLQRIMEACLQHGNGHARAVSSPDGKRLASAFFMEAHNHIIYLKGSVSEEGKKCGAMHFLMNDMIRSRSEQPVLFDFGGSSIPSLSRFFKGFGATDHVYHAIRKNNLPLILRWLK